MESHINRAAYLVGSVISFQLQHIKNNAGNNFYPNESSKTMS